MSLQDEARLALACLDLTTLNDGDTTAEVDALAARARGPFGPPAALCVWPRLAAFARRVAEALGGGVTLCSPPEHEIAGCRLGGTEVVLTVAATPPSMT